MRPSTLSASAVLLLSGLASAQTFTDCDPTKKTTCPSNPAIGGLQVTDFTAGKSGNWEDEAGTTMSYDGSLGAKFVISKNTDAPTIKNVGYLMFGRIETWVRASAGTGIVSSFILESDDLDEIDWEWLGYNNTSAENNFFGKGNTTTYNRAQYPPVSTPIDTFHNYTIDWTAEAIVWYIDGAAVRTLAYNDPLTIGGKNYPQTPMLVKMGSWIGCLDKAAVTNPATAGTCSWAGGAADLTQGPFTMYVKNVTIQDYGCATEYTYGDLSGSYQSIKATGGCSKDGKSTLSSSGSSSSTSSSSSSKSTSGSSTGSATGTATGIQTATASAGVKATATPSASGSGSGSSSGSSTLNQVSTSDANSIKKPKHEYGMLDLGVMALGLGLGYLVM